MGTLLVKEYVIEKEYAKIIAETKEVRETADYGVYVDLSKEEIEKIIKDTENFLKRIKQIISR